MTNMGLDFHRPRKSDDREWRKIEALVARGVHFSSCGCSGPGFRPRRLADMPLFERRLDALKIRGSKAKALLLKASLAKQGVRPSEAQRLTDTGPDFGPGQII
ncbi:MAG: hypothetical protein KJZ92_17800 [Rhodocyclaceae bacterium]|nr:hypothetical protein [Rhodocyclaceae bacterium]